MPTDTDKYINIEKNLPFETNILCAVSGGPDSMYMWYSILNFWIQQKRDTQNIVVIYCDHNTRESTARQQIQAYNQNRCTLIRVSRPKPAKNTEADMRKRRYQQILKTAKKYHTPVIAIGHNLTDRIESAFINMLRGCSIQWLTSLKPEEKNHPLLPWHTIIRPLADVPKEEINNVCKKHSIPYEVDPTNKDNNYSIRNKLRNDVLKKLYTQAHQGKNGNAFYQSWRNIFAANENTITTFNRQKLQTHKDRKAKRAYTFTKKKKELVTDDFYQLCQHQQQKNNITQKILNEINQFCTQKTQGYKYRNGMYFFPNSTTVIIVAASKNFWIRKKSLQKKITKTNIEREWKKRQIDKKQQGCQIQYITQDGYKKWSKSWSKRCINHKIPLIRRNHIPVIVNGNQITTVYDTFIPSWYIWTTILSSPSSELG